MDAPENDELQQAPGLRSIPRTDPFVVPDGFFERFPQVVQQRIAEDRGRSRRWSLELSGWLRPAVGALAAIVVITLAWMLWPKAGEDLPEAQVAAYETPEHVWDEIDAEDVYTALSTDDPLLAEVDLTLSDEEMADYIEQEELPLDLLIEEP
ncbi:MAG TPA: hypothetical protein VKG92_11880 [Flavobacteriales bacterium]|nr:hypothetical protein [Flavobacteriales bacterium]